MTHYTETPAPGHDLSSAHHAATHAHATIDDDAHTIMINRVAWGAIFAGVVLALVVQVLLTMLGAGIGIATLDPGTADNPAASSFSIAAAIWWVVSGIIAAFAGGYIAARMSGRTVPTTGALHGLTTWAFTTLLVLYLLTTTAGSLVGGVLSSVASAIGGMGQTVAESAAPMLAEADPLEAIERQVRATGTDPEALTNTAVNAMRQLVTGQGDPEQARQQAADTAASAISTGALVAFVALVLGAIAGWFGGRSGVVHPVYADGVMPRRRVA